MTDLDALSALLAAATPGEWFVYERFVYTTDPNGEEHLIAMGESTAGDREFIAAAHNALLALIEAARREAGLRDGLRELAAQDGLAREGTLPWEQFGPGKQDVRLRRAYHDALNQARQLLHDSAGATERAALPAEPDR